MSRSTRAGVVAVVVLVAVVTAFTVVVLGHDGLAVLDVTWREWVITHRTAVLDVVLVNASRFGSTPSLIVITLAAAGWLLWRGQRGDAAFVALSATGGMLIAPALKDLFDRARPALADHVVVVHSSSYPSAHSLGSTAVLGLLTVLAARAAARKAPVVAVGVALIALVGFSRVYLGVHYPSDVLAGWLIGATWVTLCCTIAPVVRGNRTTSGTVHDGS